MPQEHDNTNRGAAWKTQAVKGTLDVQGKKFYMDIVKTGKDAPNPLYNLYAISADSRTLYGCGLFAPKNESKAKAKGVLNLQGEGGEWWVNLFTETPDREHPKRPVVSVTVQPKEPQAAPNDYYDDVPEDNGGGDNIPF